MQLLKKLIALVVVSLLMQHTPAQLLGYKTFKLLEDNQPFKINTLFKSTNGYIYAGTSNGLYKFDGIKFSKVNFSKASVKDPVTAIFQDKENMLWVGFKNGRIAKRINGKLEYFDPEEGTPKSKITSFLQDKQNNIWFSTAGEGIYYFSNNHLYLINEDEGLSDKYVHALTLADNGDVLAATDQGINICRVSGAKKQVEVIGPKNGLPDYYVMAITAAGNNTYWIGLQEKGFCLYNHSTKEITIPAAANNWGYGQVNSLLLSQNSLWIATEENGLLKQPAINQPLVVPDIGITNQNNLNNLLQDNEGNIWFNTSAELISTAGDKLKLLPVYDKSIFETIHSVLCDYENNIWVSTIGGLIKYTAVNNKYSSKKFPVAAMNNRTDVTGLYQDIYHNIWIATLGSGIFIMDPKTGQCRNLSENPLLKNASILSITGNANTVCAGGLEGVAMIFELSAANKTIDGSYPFTNYNDISNIGNNYIYAVFKDSHGRIWFGTDGKGITVLENGRFSNYTEKDGLKDEHIHSFTEDANGNIWFFTERAGIYSFDGKKFKNYTAANGISTLRITAIKTDRLGNIIIVNEYGIDILDPRTGTVSYLNNMQGIANVNTDAGSVTQDTAGNILISTASGIVVYSPVNNSSNMPKTIIDNVQLFLQNLNKEQAGKFKHDENSFTFNFSGIYYTNPEEVHYQYKLDGLDTNWISTRDRSIPFPNLQPGKYKFHVRSSLNENFENASEATYEFAIETPIWKRFWFITGCVFVGFALLYWYMKWREAQLKKMQLLQQEKIQFQFQVLRNQVNPHFLFNSFNTLISTIEDDPKMAVDYVEQLSEFFRNIVNYRDKDIITLEEELNLMQTYFYLQQKRFGDALKMNINISEQAKQDIFIPPLTLQLLVENAIKHNAVSKETPLTVNLYIENEKRLVVQNDINPKFTKEASTGMGLQNIINRYNLLSDETVLINNDEKRFTVSLPTLKQ